MKNPQQPLIDLENRHDGPIPPSILEQMRRTSDPHTQRMLELLGIVGRSSDELKRATAALDKANAEQRWLHAKFLRIECHYHKDRMNLAKALLEREQFDD